MNPNEYTPPNSPDAEYGVLQAMAFGAAGIDTAAALLSPEDFYQPRHRLLFKAMVEMAAAGNVVDLVTLAEWLESHQILGLAGGRDYVMGLVRDAYTTANIEGRAAVVRDCAVRRSAIAIGEKLASVAHDRSQDAGEVVDGAVASLMHLHRLDVSHEWTMKQAVNAAFQQIVAAHENGGTILGVPSGLVDLDAVLGGFMDSDLIIVGARPAMGKTAFMLTLAAAAALRQFPPGIISGEQPMQQIAMRLMAAAARIDASRLRAGRIEEHEWPRLTAGATQLKDMKGWVFDRSAPSISELSRMARKWKKQNQIRGLYVDYLQRVQNDKDRENKAERVGEVARGLKNLARDLEIPVLALAQVKREVEQRPNKRPRMADLADSSEIEKEADQVLLLYRDEFYVPDSPDRGVAEILIDKNRHGPTGVVKVAFDSATMTFSNLASHLGDYGQ